MLHTEVSVRQGPKNSKFQNYYLRQCSLILTTQMKMQTTFSTKMVHTSIQSRQKRVQRAGIIQHTQTFL